MSGDEPLLLSSGTLAADTVNGFHVHSTDFEELNLELTVCSPFPWACHSWKVPRGERLEVSSSSGNLYKFDFFTRFPGDDEDIKLRSEVTKIVHFKTKNWTPVHVNVHRQSLDQNNPDLFGHLREYVDLFGNLKINNVRFIGEPAADWGDPHQSALKLMVQSVSDKVTDGTGIITAGFSTDRVAMNTFATMIAQWILAHKQWKEDYRAGM